jgi:integrase
VNLPRRSRVEKRFLSVEELHDLADIIDPRHRTLVLTAGYTGARFGELAALQPRDLDLARRRVTITRSLAEVRGVITETELGRRHRSALSRSPRLLSTSSPPTSTTTSPDAPTGCTPHPKEARCDGAASGNDSGSPP